MNHLCTNQKLNLVHTGPLLHLCNTDLCWSPPGFVVSAKFTSLIPTVLQSPCASNIPWLHKPKFCLKAFASVLPTPSHSCLATTPVPRAVAQLLTLPTDTSIVPFLLLALLFSSLTVLSSIQEMQETWGSISGPGRSLDEMATTPVFLSWNHIEEALWATVHRVTKRVRYDWAYPFYTALSSTGHTARILLV